MQLTYNLTQATELLGIHADTLKNYEKQERITPIRTEGGHRRYTIKQLYRLIKATVSIPVVPLLIQIEERNYRNFKELFKAFIEGPLMEKNCQIINSARKELSHNWSFWNPTIKIPGILSEDSAKEVGHYISVIINGRLNAPQHISVPTSTAVLMKNNNPMSEPPEILDKPFRIDNGNQDGYVNIHWRFDLNFCDYIPCEDFSKEVLYEHLDYPYCLKGIA